MINSPKISLQFSTFDHNPTLLHKLALYSFYGFVLAIPAENIILVSGIGTISRLMGIISLALWALLTVFQRLPVRRFHTAAFSFTLLFMGYGLVTTLWATYPNLSLQRTVTNIQLLSFIFLMRQFVVTDKIFRQILTCYCIGATITSLSIFKSYFDNIDHLAAYIRLTAQNFNPNEAAMYIVISILLLAHLNQTHRSMLRRIIGLGVIGLQTVAVLMTASRGAAIGMAFVYFTFSWYLFRAKIVTRILLIVFGFLFIQVVLSVVPSTSWERLSELQNLAESNLGARREIWSVSLEIFLDHPVFGVGVDSFRYKLGEYTGIQLVAHNTFVSVLVEQGIIGFTLFALILIDIILGLKYLPLKERMPLLLLVLTWSILALSATIEYQKITWFSISVPLVRIAMVQESKSDDRNILRDTYRNLA